MFNDLQFRFLVKVAPGHGWSPSEQYQGKSKLSTLLGNTLLGDVAGKTVVDFGCGTGTEAIELAQNGARKVLGLDIQESGLKLARERARSASVDAVCEFCSDTNELADLIISLDAFEHFQDPESVLRKMYSLLKPGGAVLASFGPTWFHPYGGHLFSCFPWAHVLLSEEALIRWRSTFRTDGAHHFGEVAGGLNQMTIARFERLVRRTKFSIEVLETVPIRMLELVHNRLTREFTTAVVRCKLVKPA